MGHGISRASLRELIDPQRLVFCSAFKSQLECLLIVCMLAQCNDTLQLTAVQCIAVQLTVAVCIAVVQLTLAECIAVQLTLAECIQMNWRSRLELGG